MLFHYTERKRGKERELKKKKKFKLQYDDIKETFPSFKMYKQKQSSLRSVALITVEKSSFKSFTKVI